MSTHSCVGAAVAEAEAPLAGRAAPRPWPAWAAWRGSTLCQKLAKRDHTERPCAPSARAAPVQPERSMHCVAAAAVAAEAPRCSVEGKACARQGVDCRERADSLRVESGPGVFDARCSGWLTRRSNSTPSALELRMRSRNSLCPCLVAWTEDTSSTRSVPSGSSLCSVSKHERRSCDRTNQSLPPGRSAPR